MASDGGATSGLNSAEAQAFHKYFMQYFMIFTGIAIVAHLLVWVWRPWIPGEAGWESVSSAAEILAPIAQFLT